MLEFIEYLLPEIISLLKSSYFSPVLVMFAVVGAIKLVKKVLNL